jgi:competence protein ComEC
MNKFRNVKFRALLIIISLLLSVFTGCTQTNLDSSTDVVQQESISNQLKVHFIDVGQADSILIQDGDVSMLIDAGNNPDGEDVVNYIKGQNISKLDYVIGTHPHEDHIGGLDTVIDSFDIGKIYMPKASNTTKTFKDVLNAIKNKGLKVTTPVSGSSFKLDKADATILAPNSSSYEDLNEHSIVIKLNYGSTSFLFTGDAEHASEEEIINKGFSIGADVLKVGHHGSSSSTTPEFLNRVNPKYAVIMLEKENTYGHPHKETMDKLKSKGIKVYRTDENGTIIATSDGKTITFNTEPGSYSSPKRK